MVKKTASKTATKKDTPVKEPEAQPAPAAQPAQGLNLQDLVTVAQIIQLTSQRGAFRAEELQNVGALYTKLVAFLQSTGALSTPEQQEENKNA